MWTDCRVKSGHFKILVHLATDTAATEPFTELVHEQNFGVKINIVLCSFIPVLHIMLDNLQGG